MRRLREALAAAAAAAREQQQTITDSLGKQYGAIFGAHALLVEDPSLIREVEALIKEQHFAAEYAVSRVMRRYAKALESIERGHLSTALGRPVRHRTHPCWSICSASAASG